MYYLDSYIVLRVYSFLVGKGLYLILFVYVMVKFKSMIFFVLSKWKVFFEIEVY